MPSWIWIRIRILNADPDPATQINADLSGSPDPQTCKQGKPFHWHVHYFHRKSLQPLQNWENQPAIHKFVPVIYNVYLWFGFLVPESESAFPKIRFQKIKRKPDPEPKYGTEQRRTENFRPCSGLCQDSELRTKQFCGTVPPVTEHWD